VRKGKEKTLVMFISPTPANVQEEEEEEKKKKKKNNAAIKGPRGP